MSEFVGNNTPETKTVVSVSEMARMVGLSRARFYELQKTGVFPVPVTGPGGRPTYTEELQRQCLEVRRRNCGVNGQPVLFYASRRTPTIAPPPRRTPPQPRRRTPAAALPEPDHELLSSLQALGMASVTSAQITAALAELYPTGTLGNAKSQIVRAVFLHLRRRDSGDNVRR